jgi:hypothetical protein
MRSTNPVALPARFAILPLRRLTVFHYAESTLTPSALARSYLLPALAASNCLMIPSTLKLPGACLGGKVQKRLEKILRDHSGSADAEHAARRLRPA